MLKHLATSEINISESLSHLKKVSYIAKVLLGIAIAVAVLLWIIILGCTVICEISPSILQSKIPGTAQIAVTSFLNGLLGIVLLWFGFQIFDDITKNEAPFNSRQVIRLRIVAVVFLLISLLDALFSSGFFAQFTIGQIHIGLSNPNDESTMIHINTTACLAALLFFCLSFVFKYGTLLQILSDETV